MSLLKKMMTFVSKTSPTAQAQADEVNKKKVKKFPPLHYRLPVQVSPCPHCKHTTFHSLECPEQPATDEYVQFLRDHVLDLKRETKRLRDGIQRSFKERERWEGKFRIVCHENNKLRAKFMINRKAGRGAIVSDEAAGFMPMVRWVTLMKENPSIPLTPEEIEAGWHYCVEWDGLLVGPGMSEEDTCTCATPAKRKAEGLCKE